MGKVKTVEMSGASNAPVKAELDVFISYASIDRTEIEPLIQDLSILGANCFWDQGIEVGEAWRSVIEANLADCKCQIVVWTSGSITSNWVLDEAKVGARLGRLIPISVGTEPPLGFQGIQTIALRSWSELRDPAVILRIKRAISKFCSRLQDAPAQNPSPRSADLRVSAERSFVVGERIEKEEAGPSLGDLGSHVVSRQPAAKRIGQLSASSAKIAMFRQFVVLAVTLVWLVLCYLLVWSRFPTQSFLTPPTVPRDLGNYFLGYLILMASLPWLVARIAFGKEPMDRAEAIYTVLAPLIISVTGLGMVFVRVIWSPFEWNADWNNVGRIIGSVLVLSLPIGVIYILVQEAFERLRDRWSK